MELALAEVERMEDRIMASQVKQGELRRHPRFQIHNGAMAVLSCDSRVKLGLVCDISRGGLAFSYIEYHSGGEIAPAEPAKMRITWHEREFCLRDLDCRVVMNDEISPDNSFSLLPMKKCRVKFSSLTPEQTMQLDILLASLGQTRWS